jgi:hypothetical protein
MLGRVNTRHGPTAETSRTCLIPRHRARTGTRRRPPSRGSAGCPP